jgi:hypothetical protein
MHLEEVMTVGVFVGVTVGKFITGGFYNGREYHNL